MKSKLPNVWSPSVVPSREPDPLRRLRNHHLKLARPIKINFLTSCWTWFALLRIYYWCCGYDPVVREGTQILGHGWDTLNVYLLIAGTFLTVGYYAVLALWRLFLHYSGLAIQWVGRCLSCETIEQNLPRKKMP